MNKCELKEILINALGTDRVLDELVEALSEDAAIDNLTWIAKSYDIDIEEDE